MKEELERILREANQLKEKIKSLQELESFRIKFLGRKGILKDYLGRIIKLPQEEKKKLGQELNFIKTEIEAIIKELDVKLKKEKIIKFDFRHPGKKPLIGHLNLITLSLQKIKKIFLGLGFSIVDSPEIVSEYNNFDALNIPAEHPARDLWDTLWIKTRIDADQNTDRRGSKKNISVNQCGNPQESALLLRAHTSAYQVPFIETHQPPFRIIIPGKVFRYEATDRTHDFEFHQLEGLAVDKSANLAELKGVVEKFFSEFFGKKLKVRLRPGYFPFVEPGLEIDLECVFCQNQKKHCLTCKNTKFIEIAGAGMIHPYVLKQGGLDLKEHSGYAFGFGLDRIIMLKYGIDDIRLFHLADLRFIKQF
jgi:phenylalanyl-tRNA synthetase alpha chain